MQCTAAARTSCGAPSLGQREPRSSSRGSRCVLVRAASQPAQPDHTNAGRRALLGLGLSLGLSAAAPELALAGASAPVAVGTYLPAAEGMPGFCLYQPDDKKTPAIRAGVIRPEPAFYRFALPESWAEVQLLNILTGNFCMPRCEEPWYEAKFEDPKEGTAQLVVTELQKLGAKPTAKLQDLGTPDQVVNRIGNFITGTYLDEEDVLAAEVKKLGDGKDYYVYEVYTPYSKTGPLHHLAAFTTKGGLAYLFVVTASDRQWGACQDKLRTMLASFQA